jgi:hypothetical protein
MDPFFHLVEQKLVAAVQQGLFDQLPGAGRPLPPDDLDGVPAELRAGYLLLRGAGCLPPELEARREWLRLQDLLAACQDEGDQRSLTAATAAARLRYRLLVEQRGPSSAALDYQDELLARCAGPTKHGTLG